VRQALKNVAYASSARPRGSAGPIRAEPLYCQFDLPVRRRPIGSYEVFFVLCHLVPENLNIRRASRARKLVLLKAGGPESGQRTFNVFIQSAYFVGVEPFLVHLEERPQERAGRKHLNRVADCFPRCGKSLVHHGSYHSRLVSAGEQLRGGAIVTISRSNRHAWLQSQHIKNLTGRGPPERKREDARTSDPTRSISWWFPMTEPCGINVLLDSHMGVRVDFHKENR
jgi:hypothetical protein